MISTSLSHIASVLGGRLVLRGDDTPETTVSGLVDTDSRLIEPGGIFGLFLQIVRPDHPGGA